MTTKPEAAEDDTATAAPKKISVKQYVTADEIKKDSAINPSDLSQAMMDQPGLTAHYGTQLALAEFQENKVRQLRDARAAVADNRIRERVREESGKITEAAIEKEIDRHPSVIQAQSALNEAKLVVGIAKGAVEAMKHRRDMLIQMGAQARAEMEGEIRIRSSEARAAGETAQRGRMLDKMAGAGRRAADAEADDQAKVDADADALPDLD